MASSFSSMTRRSKRSVVLIRQHNREDEYEGSMRYCHHRLLAPRWTSWSEGNPGRRFYGCQKYFQDGGYGYFAWHDGDFGERANVVIKELLDDIDKLYEENRKLRRGREVDKFYSELGTIHSEVQKLKCKHERDRRNWEKNFRVAIGTLLLIWVVVFIVYMMH